MDRPHMIYNSLLIVLQINAFSLKKIKIYGKVQKFKKESTYITKQYNVWIGACNSVSWKNAFSEIPNINADYLTHDLALPKYLFTKKSSNTYSRVHISSDTSFLKILKKPSIVQE